jgi:uncharacterized Zn finger protein (UPF0148 family)
MKRCPCCGTPLLQDMVQEGYVCPACSLELSDFGGNNSEMIIEAIAYSHTEDDDEDTPAMYAI